MFSSEHSATSILQYLPDSCHPNCLFMERASEGSNSHKRPKPGSYYTSPFNSATFLLGLYWPPRSILAKTRKEPAYFRFLTTLPVRENCLLACVPGRTGCTKRHARAYIYIHIYVLKYKLVILSCVILRYLYAIILSISVEGYKLEKWAVVARNVLWTF